MQDDIVDMLLDIAKPCAVCAAQNQDLRMYTIDDLPEMLVQKLWTPGHVPLGAVILCMACAVPCCVGITDGVQCGVPISRDSEILYADTRTTLSQGVAVPSDVRSWNGDRAQLCYRCVQPAKVRHTAARDTVLECSTTILGKVACCHRGTKKLKSSNGTMGPLVIKDERVMDALVKLQFAEQPLQLGDRWCNSCYKKATRVKPPPPLQQPPSSTTPSPPPVPLGHTTEEKAASSEAGSSTFTTALKDHRRHISKQIRRLLKDPSTGNVDATAFLQSHLASSRTLLLQNNMQPEK